MIGMTTNAAIVCRSEASFLLVLVNTHYIDSESFNSLAIQIQLYENENIECENYEVIVYVVGTWKLKCAFRNNSSMQKLTETNSFD